MNMLRMTEPDAKCIKILLDHVPLYLRGGDYFMALSENDEGSISVPDNVLKPNLSIENVRDLKHLLESLRFWIVTDSRECVEAVATYMLDRDRDGEILDISELVEEFKMTFPNLLIIHTAIQHAEYLKTNAWSALILYVLDRHPCSLDIIMHISKQHHLETCGNGTMRNAMKSKTDSCIRDFMSQYSIHSVIGEGNIDLLKLLYNHNIRSSDLCETAGNIGSVECLHFLRSKGESVPRSAASDAAGRGHVNILKYCHENGLLLGIACSDSAAANGHLECLRYLHSIGHPWGPNVLYYAAYNGHLECLRFAHENKCIWHEYTCSAAVWSGHLACLKYAHENGCEWDIDICELAIERGHFACLQYALEHGCPYETCLPEYAFHAGHNEIGFYILEHCANLSDSVCTFAAMEGRLDILQACVRAGIPWPSDIVATATRSGHRHCAEFALANGAPGLL